MTAPDYSSYSSQDLLSVSKHIDRDRYPERYAHALEELKRRETEGYGPPEEISPAEAKATAKRANRIFWAFLLGIIAIGAVTVGVTSAKRSQEEQANYAKSQRGIDPVQTAVEEGLTAESVDAKLEYPGGTSVIALTLTNVELGESSEEEVAESIAAIAYQAFEKRKKLDGVRVVFVTKTKKFLGSETENGDPHKFSSEDLRGLIE